MAVEKILKDEVIRGIIKNEVLRIEIAGVMGHNNPENVRLLARKAQINGKRNKLYDSEVLNVIKRFFKYKSINQMYK